MPDRSVPENSIAVLDSGIGGLPYLDRCREVLPGFPYIYIADTEHFPYGEKNIETIIDMVFDTVERLIQKFRPAICVVACNTASVVALSALRNRFDIPFVGVVPAVKPAAERSRNRRIGLLATNRTVLDRYTDDLIRDFAEDCHIERIGDGSIVDFVEYRFVDATESERSEAIRVAMDSFRSAKIDTLVLGCTHFIFLESQIRESLDTMAEIVDSRDGVAKQLSRLAVSELENATNDVRSILLTTGNNGGEERYRRFCDRFDLEYRGVME